MADEQIVTSIVAKADLSNLVTEVHRVTSSLQKLQRELLASNKSIAAATKVANNAFRDTLVQSGLYSSHFVNLQSDVDKFGKNLDSGRLKLKDYFSTFQQHAKTSKGLIRELAREQVMLQNAVLQPLGRNAQGLMQFNVAIPRGLDVVKNKTQLARMEMQIMNRALSEGATSLINWGKNTQWAGRQLTVGLTVPLTMFGTSAAKAFREADQELTRLTKVYGGLAATSSQELGAIRKEVAQTAKELSAAYGVSFKETIALAADIAATGKQGSELLGSIRETTRLATLGEVDRQDAMKATLAIQSAFKQNTEELSASINFLNAVENQTSTTLNDLVEAIPKAGPVIKGLGGSVQDLALYLTAMREGGINASEGANALKSGLASLINPTKVAQARFKEFGIDLMGIVNTNAGNVTETLLALQSALDTLNPLQKQQALEQLFGKFQFARMNALFENLGKSGSQTIQVLELMKASASDLAGIAERELKMVTESASGKFKRAMEAFKASLAGFGEQFLNFGTKILNVLTKVMNFFNNLPGPIKKFLALFGGLTAIAGPLIMITGVLANFFGYITKGIVLMRQFFMGQKGWKMLTPEMIAAQKAAEMVEKSFYSDAAAAEVLSAALNKLTLDYANLEKAMLSGTIPVNPTVTTVGGSPIIAGGYRQVDPTNPLVGEKDTRAMSHINPRDPGSPASIFGGVPTAGPVNQAIRRTPQIFMTERLPDIEGLTSVKGVSTGIVAGETAKFHALMATLGMQTEAEVATLKKTIALGGTVSSDLLQTFDDILPITQRFATKAAEESALIVSELRAGKITVDQAKARIIALNADIELMMQQEIGAFAASRGRTIDFTKAPLMQQPVVDAEGNFTLRDLYKKSGNKAVMEEFGRLRGIKTYGAPYTIHVTRPPRFNTGGDIEGFGPNKTVVSGPTSINYDDRLGSLPLDGYVLNQDASMDPANQWIHDIAPYTYDSSASTITAEVTPGELVLGPGIHKDPLLYAAVDAANNGYNFGGNILRNKANYGRRNPLQAMLEMALNSKYRKNLEGTYMRRALGIRDRDATSLGSYGIHRWLTRGETTNLLLKEYIKSLPPKDRAAAASLIEKFGASVTREGEITSRHTKTIEAGHLDKDGILDKALKKAGLPGLDLDTRLHATHLTQAEVRGGQRFVSGYTVMYDARSNLQANQGTLLVADFLARNMTRSQKYDKLFKAAKLDKKLWAEVEKQIDKDIKRSLAGSKNKKMGDEKGDILFQDLIPIIDANIVAAGGNQKQLNLLKRNRIPRYALGGPVSSGKFGYGRMFVGMPTEFSKVSKYRGLADQISARVSSSKLRFVKPTDYGHLMQETTGHSFPIPKVGGIYRKPNGDVVFVKPMMDEASAKAELRATAITNYAHKPLRAPKQTMRVMKDPTDPTGKRKFIVLESPYDPRMAEVSKRFTKKEMISQNVASFLRGDKDLSLDNVSGSRVADTGTSYVYRRASGRRYLGESIPSMKEMAMIDLLGVKGGAKKAYAQNTAAIAAKMTPDEYHNLMIAEIERVLPRLKKIISTFKLNNYEKKIYADVVRRLEEGARTDWRPFQRIHASAGGYNRGGGIIKGGRRNYGWKGNAGSWRGDPKYDKRAGSSTPIILAAETGAGGIQESAAGLSKVDRYGGAMTAGFGLQMAGSMVGGTWGNAMMMGGLAMQFSPFIKQLGPALAKLNTFKAVFTSLGNVATKVGGLLFRAIKFPFTPTGAIITAITTIVGLLLKWKKYSEDVGKLNRLEFGGTAKQYAQVGIKNYKSLTDRLKEYNEQLELNKIKIKTAFEAYTKNGPTGITLTIKQLNEAIKNAKENQKDYVEAFNTMKTERVVAYAANLKAQFVALGLSASEAANQIYAIIKASNKASQAVAAVTSLDFREVIDQTTALAHLVKNLSSSIETNFNAETFNLGIDAMVNGAMNYMNFLMTSKETSKEITDQYDALVRVLDEVAKVQGSSNLLTAEQINKLKEENLLYANILGITETTQSILAKIILYQSGMAEVVNLAAMAADEAVRFAKNLKIVDDTINSVFENQNDKQNPLQGLAAALAKAKSAAETTKTALATAQKFDKDAIEELIKKQQELIDEIEKEREARLKVLEIQEKAANFETDIKSQQIKYQQAMAAGDMAQAAQAQLEIERLSSNRQRDLAKQAINDKADRDKEAAQAEIDRLQGIIDAKEKAIVDAQKNNEKNQASKDTVEGLINTIEDTVRKYINPDGSAKPMSETDKQLIMNTIEAMKGSKDADIKKMGEDLYSKYVVPGKYQGSTFTQPSFNSQSFINDLNKYLMEKGNSANSQFAAAVDKFAAAVNQFGMGPNVTNKAYYPAGEEDKNIKFNQDEAWMLFSDPSGKRKIAVTGYSRVYEDIYKEANKKGWLFQGYNTENISYWTGHGQAPKGYEKVEWNGTGSEKNIPKLAAGGYVQHFEPGGPVSGPGTATSDSIPAMLSNGEYVINAASAQAIGYDTLDKMNAVKKASGGAVFKNGSLYAAAGTKVIIPDKPSIKWSLKEKQDYLMSFLMNKGITYNSALGIVANLMGESTLNPNAKGDWIKGKGYTSHGIAQWRLGRFDALKKFAKDNKMNWNSIETQAEFLWKELQQQQYRDILYLFKHSSTSALKAAHMFLVAYERPKDQTLAHSQRRLALMKNYTGFGDTGASVSNLNTIIPSTTLQKPVVENPFVGPLGTAPEINPYLNIYKIPGISRLNAVRFAKGGKAKSQGTYEGYDPSVDYFKRLGDLSVNFKTDVSTLSSDQISELFSIAMKIKKTGVKKLSVNGYADQRGSNAYNISLSRRRAEYVASLLRQFVPGVEFIPQALGEQAGPKSYGAMSRERRVSIELPLQSGGLSLPNEPKGLMGSVPFPGIFGGSIGFGGMMTMAKGGKIKKFKDGGRATNNKYTSAPHDMAMRNEGQSFRKRKPFEWLPYQGNNGFLRDMDTAYLGGFRALYNNLIRPVGASVARSTWQNPKDYKFNDMLYDAFMVGSLGLGSKASSLKNLNKISLSKEHTLEEWKAIRDLNYNKEFPKNIQQLLSQVGQNTDIGLENILKSESQLTHIKKFIDASDIKMLQGGTLLEPADILRYSVMNKQIMEAIRNSSDPTKTNIAGFIKELDLRFKPNSSHQTGIEETISRMFAEEGPSITFKSTGEKINLDFTNYFKNFLDESAFQNPDILIKNLNETLSNSNWLDIIKKMGYRSGGRVKRYASAPHDMAMRNQIPRNQIRNVPVMRAAPTGAAARANSDATRKWYEANNYYKNWQGNWTKRGPSQWQKYTTLQNWKDLAGGLSGNPHGEIYNDIRSKIFTTLFGAGASKRDTSGKGFAGGEYLTGLSNVGLVGSFGSAVGRGFIEQFGIMHGIPNLGKLLPQGSIPYLGRMAPKAINNVVTAALLGAARPFVENRLAPTIRKPKIKVTSEQIKPNTVHPPFIIHEGKKIPVHSGPAFGNDAVVFEGIMEDFSTLASSGKVDAVIPTTPEGILSYILKKNPKDKTSQRLLDKFNAEKYDDREVKNFLMKLFASGNIDLNKLNPLELIYQKGSDGPAQLISAMRGNLRDSAAIEAKKKALSPILNRITKEYIENVKLFQAQIEERIRYNGGPKGGMSGSRGEAPLNRHEIASLRSRGWNPYVPYNPDQVPMIRVFNHGFPMLDKNGDYIEQPHGFDIFKYLIGPGGKNYKNKEATPDSRNSLHFAIYDAVQSSIFHMSSKWEANKPFIVSTLSNLMKYNGKPEQIHSNDSFWLQKFGKPFKYSRKEGKTVAVLPLEKSAYIKKLKELDLYKQGQELPIMVESPTTKEIFYLAKEKYNSKELDQIMKEVNSDYRLRPIKKVDDGFVTDFNGGEYSQSAQRALQILAINKAKKQIGIDESYSYAIGGDTTGIYESGLQELAAKIGVRYSGAHQGTNLKFVDDGSGENPLRYLLNEYNLKNNIPNTGVTTPEKTLGTLLMHARFGKYESGAWRADEKSLKQMQEMLITQYARGLISGKQFENQLLEIKNLLEQQKGHGAMGGYVKKTPKGGYIGKLHNWNGPVPGPYGEEVNATLLAGQEYVGKTSTIAAMKNGTMNPSTNNKVIKIGSLTMQITEPVNNGRQLYNEFRSIVDFENGKSSSNIGQGALAI